MKTMAKVHVIIKLKYCSVISNEMGEKLFLLNEQR